MNDFQIDFLSILDQQGATRVGDGESGKGEGVDLFAEAKAMYKSGLYQLILHMLDSDHPTGVSEEAIILARMAEAMAEEKLFQRNGKWIYKED